VFRSGDYHRPDQLHVGEPARQCGRKVRDAPEEEVAVADTGITIRLNEVGHQTFSGPTPSRRAAAYAVLAVSAADGSRTVRLDVGEDEQVGDYLIKLNSANPSTAITDRVVN
jgi:hypothetical protein